MFRKGRHHQTRTLLDRLFPAKRHRQPRSWQSSGQRVSVATLLNLYAVAA